MRVPSQILAVMAATLLTGLAGSQEKTNPSAKVKAGESATKVKELQKERIATLQVMVDISYKLTIAGRLEMEQLLEARMSLLKAELETAEKEADRTLLYKAALDSLKVYHEIAKAKYEAARGTELDVYRVKAKRLEIEIALERAKVKLAKEGK